MKFKTILLLSWEGNSSMFGLYVWYFSSRIRYNKRMIRIFLLYITNQFHLNCYVLCVPRVNFFFHFFVARVTMWKLAVYFLLIVAVSSAAFEKKNDEKQTQKMHKRGHHHHGHHHKIKQLQEIKTPEVVSQRDPKEFEKFEKEKEKRLQEFLQKMHDQRNMLKKQHAKAMVVLNRIEHNEKDGKLIVQKQMRVHGHGHGHGHGHHNHQKKRLHKQKHLEKVYKHHNKKAHDEEIKKLGSLFKKRGHGKHHKKNLNHQKRKFKKAGPR